MTGLVLRPETGFSYIGDETSGFISVTQLLSCFVILCSSVTYNNCSIVLVLQTYAFSSSPAVTRRWPSGENLQVRTPDALTWKLGRPRLPLCKKVQIYFDMYKNTNQN